MRDAAGRLCGHHDFRNLCKMDVGNGVVEYRRRLDRVTITALKGAAADGGGGDGSGGGGGGAGTGGGGGAVGEEGYQMYQLEVRGNAFLWHQIRYRARGVGTGDDCERFEGRLSG